MPKPKATWLSGEGTVDDELIRWGTTFSSRLPELHHMTTRSPLAIGVPAIWVYSAPKLAGADVQSLARRRTRGRGFHGAGECGRARSSVAFTGRNHIHRPVALQSSRRPIDEHATLTAIATHSRRLFPSPVRRLPLDRHGFAP
jgi:hypothetical protein